MRRHEYAHRRRQIRGVNYRGDSTGRLGNRERRTPELGRKVLAEVSQRAWNHAGGCAEELGNERHLTVVALLVFGRELLNETLVDLEGGVDERRVYPEHQLRVERRIARPRREAAELRFGGSPNARVHRAHDFTGALRFGLRAECHQIERAQSPDESAPQIGVVVGVLDDPRRDEGMCHLEQHRRAAAEERRRRRVAHSTNHALRLEVAIPTRQPLGVRARDSHIGPVPGKGDSESVD
jgi:hypothetical protein